MKIVLITGSFPPDVCGVAEYTERLAESLEKAGAEVVLFTGKRWDLTNAVSLGRELAGLHADILHMQYPATGYGWRLGPQLLSLLQPFAMTIHECSQTHVLRRLSLYPFTVRARKIIFTNEYERAYSFRFAPWIKNRSTVLPIGSGAPLAPAAVSRMPNMVTYFGLIRPQKGLEQVIELARLCKERNNGLRVRIVGTVLPGYEDYYGRLRNETNSLPVVWTLGLNGVDLSNALAETWIAYQPFPDGASERRSSLIAMLVNKAAVITTRGTHTPSDMEDAVRFASSPAEAAATAEDLFGNPERLQIQQLKAAKYAVKFSWSSIAAEHMDIYEQLIADRRK